MNLFKKIDLSNILFEVTKDTVSFQYTLNEKQEKELNAAAGKIHRGITENAWTIDAETLKVTFPISEVRAYKISFNDISRMFEDMVK